MKEISYLYSSPLGDIMLTEAEGALIRVSYQFSMEGQEQGEPEEGKLVRQEEPATPLLRETLRQLEEYFVGKRTEFHLALRLQGTEFQQNVWQALLEIPYGETRSYSQIAERVGNPKAVRAVGMANHRNPIMIIVPCHRVIGKNKSLTGYAYGIERKEALLRLETEHAFP